MGELLGAALKAARFKTNATQTAVSRRIGMCRETLHGIESGTYVPRVNTLKKLIGVYGPEIAESILDAYCKELLEGMDSFTDLVKIIECTSVYCLVPQSTFWHNMFSNVYDKHNLKVGKAAAKRISDTMGIMYDDFITRAMSNDDVIVRAKLCAKVYAKYFGQEIGYLN